MTDILSLLESLDSTPSRNDKIRILEDNRDNWLLKDVFAYALNPMLSYNIRALPEYTTARESSLSLAEFLSELSKFQSREISGHAAILHLSDLLSRLPYRDSIVACRIISRDLRCGVAASTANKIWKKLIPEWPCLLGTSRSDIQGELPWPMLCQTKFDGVRANALCIRGPDGKLAVEIYGRSGKRQDFRGEVESKIAQMFNDVQMESFVLDGELVVVSDTGKILPRKTGNGIINKAIKGTISHEESDRVRMKVWDLIPYQDFIRGQSLIPYSDRLSLLDIMYAASTQDPVVEIVETTTLHSDEQAAEMFAKALSEGLEGIMLKEPSVFWSDTRSKQVIKYKSEKEADLVVVEWNEGTGKFKGMLGSLVCRTACNQVEVSVSGFTDDERMLFTPEFIIGQIITVKYNEVIDTKSKDAHGNLSLFLPRFVEIRHDKTVANTLGELE